MPLKYAYFVGSLLPMVMWLALYWHRKDLRREMWVMSLAIGILSVATGYYWWTIDWWQPLTITGTRVGIEDFLVGFGSGGIMAVVYEVVFKRRHYKRKPEHHYPGPLTIFLMLAFATAFLIWGVGLTSFTAGTIAMGVTAAFMFYYRKDLLLNGLLSGTLMAAVSLAFYYPILWLSPGWVEATYIFDNLSGILITGVPIEEFVFWFMAGVIFGPFYEYSQGERLRKMRARL